MRVYTKGTVVRSDKTKAGDPTIVILPEESDKVCVVYNPPKELFELIGETINFDLKLFSERFGGSDIHYEVAKK